MLHISSRHARALGSMPRYSTTSARNDRVAPRIVPLTTLDAYEAWITARHKRRVVYFTAHWSGPCTIVRHTLRALCASYPTIGFAQVDVHAMDDAAILADVCDMPTFHFYLDGKRQPALACTGLRCELLQCNVAKLADGKIH
ncbi:hypothetical protein SPRG_01833 [Saprolegnia parasitica CBS 223.65]|uniref:Thioredoxin domain-containing protein n=1 Tax=Saprolegnia parasitica (strain CBS 223.65) TaxID=695850 RepID=A0A067D1V9_SAPPC|nr:hypothetical protein SPRG_01833 [Saprolegnia parasitica CBS 223.65]KDO33017.1 hypothetical protein SPRG_01833 [Saprolegnia parasitica CBS 223.65]|eukprot:XP_012195791.1 hypothetical protein SPRG_01833 [Saprolegnia parasitica CBS 223.65]